MISPRSNVVCFHLGVLLCSALGTGLGAVACASSEPGFGAATASATSTTVPEAATGMETMPTPSATGSTAPAPPLSEAYKTEKIWAEARKVTVEPGKVSVVAKRKGATKRSMVYEDEFVVFQADGNITRFIGTTKPAQMPRAESSVVPDVDKDGRKDLGIVRPGTYVAHGSVTYGIPDYERTAFKIKMADGDGYLPAWRDLSGDGVYSDDEKTTAVQRDYKISGIYIHYGFADSGTKLGSTTYNGPWSVGCQNIKYAELDAFVAAVGGADAQFQFSIVDANQ
jgi:hypothetical protein